jgi:hypothetical protein
VATEPGAGLHPTACDPRADPAATEQPTTGREVIALIGMELGWTATRSTGPSPRSNDRRHGIHHGLEQL